MLGLALWGFRNVLGKQPLLPAGAMEDSGAAPPYPNGFSIRTP